MVLFAGLDLRYGTNAIPIILKTFKPSYLLQPQWKVFVWWVWGRPQSWTERRAPNFLTEKNTNNNLKDHTEYHSEHNKKHNH